MGTADEGSKAAPSASQPSRNEYIPAFITKKPFYLDDESLGSDLDYLEHQRLRPKPDESIDHAKWYDRGRKVGPAPTKFRKGACENCGAMTHRTKDCLNRPRKLGAKWTGKDIQADEVVEKVELGWDAKRDRYNGYDSRNYDAVVKEYETLDAMKRAARAATGGSKKQNTEKDGGNGGESEPPDFSPEHENNEKVDEIDDNDEHRYAEESNMGRNQPTSTRQLRLREDTAKYLRDLDLDSARYDPKTRTMDTTGALGFHSDGTRNLSLAEENFTPRMSGDAIDFERAQFYAWETQEKGVGLKTLHLQANPTEGDLLRKKLAQVTEVKRAAQRRALLEKYGDEGTSAETGAAQSLDPESQSQQQRKRQRQLPPPVQSSERYVEYDEHGRVKSREEASNIKRSKYAEDLRINNHTTTWGSWWHNFTWGYECCHSTVRNSYCTGEEGKRAFEETERLRNEMLFAPGHEEVDEEQEGKDEGGDAKSKRTDRDEDQDQAAQQHQKKNEKKRPLQALHDGGVTEEEMEAYKRNRVAADDPMAGILGRDELVH